MTVLNDQIPELIKGCIANKRSAQEQVYKWLYADMLRISRRYTKSEYLAKEALNTAFLKVFQNISSFDNKKGELRTWIRAILIRTCIDMVRKEAKFVHAIDMDEVADVVFIQPNILEKLQATDILNMIQTLPSATQLVFNLYTIDGYSHQEIAAQLQITESTSRWHLSEARRMLKQVVRSMDQSIGKPLEGGQHQAK